MYACLAGSLVAAAKPEVGVAIPSSFLTHIPNLATKTSRLSKVASKAPGVVGKSADEQGTFEFPKVIGAAASVSITATELSLILGGVSLSARRLPRYARSAEIIPRSSAISRNGCTARASNRDMADGAAILDHLPTDVTVLHGMIRELVTSLQTERRRNDQLVHRLDPLLKRVYGPRSDQLNPSQMTLFHEASDPSPSPPSPPPQPVVITPNPKTRELFSNRR